MYCWLFLQLSICHAYSGHRIGTAEVESALVSHPQCAEAAVVGVEHEVPLTLDVYRECLMAKCLNLSYGLMTLNAGR